LLSSSRRWWKADRIGPRAIGDGLAVVLVAQLIAVDQPPIMDVNAEGTPLP
jgi:hypothetical protein